MSNPDIEAETERPELLSVDEDDDLVPNRRRSRQPRCPPNYDTPGTRLLRAVIDNEDAETFEALSRDLLEDGEVTE